jgi:hypothetical protein
VRNRDSTRSLALRATLAIALVFAMGCERVSHGRQRWIECERALLSSEVAAETRDRVGAVARTFDVACGADHRRVCVPHALPAEAALQIQHRHRVSAARVALAAGRDELPGSCRDLPD